MEAPTAPLRGAPPTHARVPAARTPARRPRAPKPVPVATPEHAHLDLAQLRDYRAELQAEEGRVSYWRRIIQARLDVVRAGRTAARTGPLDAARLRPVLTDSRIAGGRTHLVQVLPADDIPPLPSLGELWERRVDPGDLDALAALERDLDAAEEQLSAYRSALHTRLEQATGELIARYRDRPQLCLAALPQAPARRRG